MANIFKQQISQLQLQKKNKNKKYISDTVFIRARTIVYAIKI